MSDFSQWASYVPSSPRRLVSQLNHLLRSRLWAQVIAAMALGITLGLALSPSGGALVPESTAKLLGAWLALPGRLFLALIQMVVLPLIISSIVLGIASSGDLKFLKQVGLRIAPYFLLTTSIAVVIGAIAVYGIEPGSYLSPENTPGVRSASSTSEVVKLSLPDQIIQIIPANPLQAMLSGSMFQVVILSIFIAVALVSISPRRARPLVDVFVAFQDISMKIVGWAMAMAPIAVFGLLAQVSIQIGFEAVVGVGAYLATVLLGLAALLLFYLVIVSVLGGTNPVNFLKSIWATQLLAFSTSSSAAVMPMSMQTAEEELGVSKPISQFVIPLGATVNMDGTALYQVVAAVFLTQAYGIDLSIAELVFLAATTVGASIGSPSTPGVGIVILATVVHGMGVPTEGIALVLGVDRLLDMSRTSVNVSGDLVASVVMNRWLSKVIRSSDHLDGDVDQASFTGEGW